MPLKVAASLLLGIAVACPVRAVCTAGAVFLRVPEDCATVAAAVTAAGDHATIDIAAGTYSFAGGPLVLSNVGKSLTLAARQPRAVTFDGGAVAQIVRIVNDGINDRPVTFEGIRFVNGASSTANRAGGITLTKAEATFVDCDFEDNRQTNATTGGGALQLYGGSTAIVARSIFTGNRASNQGGAIYVLSNGDGESTLWVIGSSFVDNSTAESGFTATATGGAINVRDGAVRVADTEFRNNRAGRAGGAIYAFGNWDGSAPFCNFAAAQVDVLLTHVAFVENVSDDAANAAAVAQTFGGAIHIENCVRARLYASLVERNEADQGGAASVDHSRFEVEQSVFRDNRTTLPDTTAVPVGGVIHAFSRDTTTLSDPDYPSAGLTLRRSLFQGALDESAAAHVGGCVRVAGDESRWSVDGVQAGYRAPVELTDSVLFGCAVDVLQPASPLASGGGIDARLVDQDWTRVLLARNRADGGASTNGVGGGGALWSDSANSWVDVVFSGNSAEHTDPDLFVQAGDPVPSGFDAWTATSASPAGGLLVAAPSLIPAGGWPFEGEAWLGFGWSGSAATLDGDPLAFDPKNGLVAAAPGSHTLDVDGLGSCARCSDDVDAPPAPAAALTASPESITTAQSSTLSWQATVSSGTFLTSIVDRGVGVDATASGNASVSPDGSTTYRYLVFSAEGGALAERRLFVGEPAEPDEPIFASDFEVGLFGWSAVAP